ERDAGRRASFRSGIGTVCHLCQRPMRPRGHCPRWPCSCGFSDTGTIEVSMHMNTVRRNRLRFTLAGVCAAICAITFAGGVREAPGYLGFLYTLQDDPPPSTQQWLHVRSVLPGGPAQTAGVRSQDIIVA